MSADQHDEVREGHTRLEQIASHLKAGDKIEPVIVRDLLRWFGARYRGTHVNDLIRDTLYQNNLRVEPGINEQRMDGSVEFREGVVIDEIDEKFFANYRQVHEGDVMNEIEANFLQKLWIERLSDVATGWIDRNPDATETQRRDKILALNELDWDRLLKEESAYIVPFPPLTIRLGLSRSGFLNAIYERRSRVIEVDPRNRHRLYTAIGHFVFEFSQLERMIRLALGEALELSDDRFHIITSPYDFAALCGITQNIYRTVLRCTEEDRAELGKLLNECRKINDERNRIAHGTWFISEEGSGTEHVSRSSREPKIYYSRIEELEKVCGEVTKLKSRLERLLIGQIRHS